MFKKIFFLAATALLAGCMSTSTPDYQEFSARFTGERTELYHGETKWDFEKFLTEELKNNPAIECTDLVKFCCQAAFGIEKSSESGIEKFSADFEKVKADKKARLIQVTSPDTARVNIAAWKGAGLPAQWLLRMSVVESEFADGSAKMAEYTEIAAKMLEKYQLNFSREEFLKAAEKCGKSDHKHYRHSQEYKKNNPPYRLISTRYFHTLPVLMKAAEIKEKATPKVIAIDGRSASGKTTLANQLKIILDAQVIHMDDFFLPLSMRTAMRYEEAGGNVHYERLMEEVLSNLKKNEAFSYKIFDCKKLDYNGRRMIWAESRWRIVEGAYSLHGKFGNYADLKIFYDITPAEQMRRINERNGSKAAQMFKSKWIPLEEKYIGTFGVDKKADLIIR